ncbi:TonB-dependent receptor [Aurantibacter sp.]|uniref:SusC/RagA family TonB-linked outer membrane protein n=1 Tax=Aurantibacter sp. TaxID=2807103 RepID=UPI0032643A32
MIFKNKLALILALFVSMAIFAQDGSQLTGTIVDADNIPIAGANVIIANTTTGTATDFDGNYEITVNEGDQIQFSYIGFVTQTIPYTGQGTLDVTMAEDAALLDEVVVVGYGTRKKSHLTGAVAKVKGDAIAGIQAARVDDALAGKLPGVLIQNQSGAPGADPKIQIRAASSITGNSDPLIVVDGYPISGSLATVNPNDIESLEVLKDAASAAIYGSRGANGVILITSKKGRSGKTKFSYNAYTSFSNKYVDNIKMTASEFADYADASIANGNWDVSELEAAAPGYTQFKINAYRNAPDVVAREDYFFGTGSTQSHDFSMSGGSEDSNFFASMGYQDTEGVVINQGFERLNARLSADTKLGKKFKAGISFNGFASDRSDFEGSLRDANRQYDISPIYHTPASIAFVQELEAQHQALGYTVNRSGAVSGFRAYDTRAVAGDLPGLFPQSIYDLQPGDPAWDWHYGRDGNGIGGSGNPGTASIVDNKSNTEKTYFANISSYLSYAIAEGLTLKTVLGGDYRATQFKQHALITGDGGGELKDTYLDQQDVQTKSMLSVTTLDYNTVLNDKHDISAVIGVEFQKNHLLGTSIEGNNVEQRLGEPLNYAFIANANTIVTERNETIHRESIFGRIAYAYDNRYLISASVRRDGDSRFGANNKHEIFPAFSLGWNIHNESFWNSESFISTFKPRVSYGSLGTTSNLGAYNALSFANPATTPLGNAFLIPSDTSNPDLTWQTNTETNYGIDLGFANNRFTLGVDYYTSDIENILIDLSVSEVLGRSSIRVNSGDVKSSGMEFEMNAGIVRNDNFNWSLGANLSTVNTEITDLGPLTQLPDQIYGTSGRGAVYRNYVGGEIGELWGLQTTGWVDEVHMINPTDVIGASSGEVYVVDQNGDGVIDATKTVEDGGDLVKLGTNTPDFYWGLNSNMSYKNLDLSFQLQGSHGAVLYNVDPLYYGSNWGGRLRESFDADGDGIEDATGKHYTRARDQTDATVQDAGYVALRNLTLGYTFNPDLMSKIGLNSIRIYGAATNLLYIVGDDYTSYNPEGINTSNSGYGGPITSGHQEGAYPVLRTFTLGLNVNF